MTLPVTAPALEAWLVSRLAESCALEPDRIDVRERFSRYGLDSLRATRLIARLSAHLGRPLSATLAWEQPTIEALVAHLTGEGASSPALTGELERAYGAQEPIAIVGMACRFPGAPDPASFWRLLRDGVTAVSEVPQDRGWDELLSTAGVDPAERDKVRRGAFLERIDTFDPLFFGISPREAIAMDPQQRLMLELCWEALEDGGIRPGSLRGTRTGVFAGAIWSEYASLLYRGGPERLGPYTVTGSHQSIIANRISYVLGLEGPSLTLDSACSSGLVVAHLACESLRRGESRVALAGAVNLNVLPESALAVSRFGALSPDGRCYTFDARANGYVRGEGGGVLVLKTLSRALADGDPIRAVIRGAAVNNDGASNGLTAPSRAAQEAVLREACHRAGVRPEAVQYIEAHGTGTPLGDPIEARALGAVFGASRPAEAPLLIGSVKTNVGHLEGAAGIAGLAKVVLAIENRVLPPSLNFESPNPHAPLTELGLAVTASARPWPAPEQPLTAGVSSFGLGGTNGHVVVQEWPGPVAEALSTSPAKALLASGADGKSPGVVFVFPGQGAQWHGMALTVLHSEPVFRAAIEACDQHIRRFMGWSLLEELTAPREASRLDDIEVSLPAIIAIDIAVSAWWRSMGIEPAAVVGHSTGEIAAAHVAGALDLEDTMRVICAYGRFVGRFSGRGAMAFVGLSWDAAEGALAGFEGRVFRAIQDSAEGTVVAGDLGAIAELLGALQSRGVFCRPVAMNVAPHSPFVDSVREELFEALRGIRPRKGSIPLISEVTGAELDGRSLDAAHWVRNFGDPAFFSRAIDELIGRGHRVFLDVGPHPITRHSVETNLRRLGAGPSGGGGVVLPSLRRDEDGRSTLRSTLATLHSLGAQTRSDELEPTGNDASLPGAGAWLLPLSAKSPEALTALAGAYADLLKPGATAARLRDITYTASVRREHHPYRLAVAGRSREELSEALAAFARGDAGAKVARGQVPLSSPPKVAFVFSGNGSQWLGMGRTLLAEEPVFRAAIEACDEAIAAEAGFSVLAELHADEATSRLERIDVVQPMLFAVGVALAALWRSWGVTPDCVVGHSMGEVVAAHVAGILSLPDAVRVMCRRSRLIQRTSGQGTMAVVELTAIEAEKALAGYEDRLSVAVCNAPRSTGISGDPAALGAVMATLEARGVFCRRIKIDFASHSPQMDPLLGELLSSLSEVRPGEGRLAMRSTVTGAMVNGPELDADYWARNLRAPVRFAGAIQALVDDGHALFVEISPHPILLPAVEENIREQKREGVSIASVRRGSDERRSMLEALGAAWTRGVSVDLGALYPAGGRVVALPAYPWQRERYWVEAAASEAPAARGRSHAGGHPLLGRGQTLSTQTGIRLWETTLDVQRLPWLRDHQVQGVVVFPGAGTLEMALAAGEEAFDRSPFLVTGVSFVEVLALGGAAATEVQVVTTEEQPGRLRFQVASLAPGAAGSAWTVHARGTLERGEGASASPRLDLNSLRARLVDPEPAQSLYAALSEMGLDYGPAFRGLVELWSGEGEALGRVRLPEAAGAVAGYRLHPALLDACFHVLAGALRGGDKASWMPVEVGSLRMLQRPLGELFCHATIAPVARGSEKRRSADLVLVDAQGILVAEIQGLVVERLSSRAPRREEDDWFLELAWEAAPVSAPSVRAGRFLLLGGGGGLGAGLRAELATAGHAVVQAVVGAPGKVPAGCWPVDDASPVGVRALLADAFGGQAPSAVVHLRSLEGSGGLDADALEAAFARGYDSVLHTVQALSGMGYRDAPRLWLVTRGAQAVGGGDIAVEQAPLLGLSRVIALEHQELRCARVDLDPARPEHEIEALSAELLADGAESEVALRGGERRVARLSYALPEVEVQASVPIRQEGSYLVTGGLGGLGLRAAGWLAEQGAGHLVLLGRGGAASPEQQAAVAALEALGARVTVARADVADRAAIERVLAGVAASGMPLSGIVHAAGVLDDGLVAQQTSARFRRVMAPKVLGAVHLHELTRNQPLDFFVMYASVAGLLGSPGQGNYAAANTFLDALAHHRRAEGLPATSIDWGGFSEVGLAASQDNRGARLASRGMRSLTPAEGLTALRRVLDEGRAQVGVAPLDVRQWVEFYPAAASSPMLSRLRTEAPASGGRAAGEAELVEQLARAEPAARPSLLLGFVRGQAARVLRIAEDKLDPSAPLTSFGMDSLTSLELRNRLEAALGVQMPATLLWTYPTVTALCGHLSGADFGFSVPGEAAPAKEPLAPLVPVSALDELSDHALMAALRSEL
jgi:acyl transferase domain-containing protein/acyl carrier protein